MNYISRSVILLIVCLVAVLCTPVLKAQNISNIDITSIDVDALTDDQLRSYVERAESSGYSQQQLEVFARQRGMSESQIIKLRRRVEQLGQVSSSGRSDTGVSSTSRNNLNLSYEDVFGNLAEGMGITPMKDSEVFGINLFRSQNLNFSPNLNIPTPPNYVLSSGDELVVDLWGAAQKYMTFEVSPEGTIRPQDLGPIYVSGLTIKAAREKIVSRLSEVYAGLKRVGNQEPTIFSQITLGNIRTINVTVVGEVSNPGNYALNSLSTVYTALHAVGGPTEQGTFRSVRLIRDNKVKVTVDLYDFLVNGIKSNDLLLKDGDVIIVKPYLGQVTVEGEVRRPGIYEISEGETFKHLLEYSAGFTSEAYKNFITVNRNSASGRKVLNIPSSELGQYTIEDGDQILVKPNPDLFLNRVQIEGAIHVEGAYELTEGLSLKQLIGKAGGLKGDAYLERANIYRMNGDFSEVNLAVDLQKLMSGAVEDIPLLNEDVVRISSIYNLREEFYVEVSGEVLAEGTYPFISNMTVEDIVLIAGGLREGASGARVEISRRNKLGAANTLSEIITLDIDKDLQVSGSNGLMKLEPFDQVFIRRTANYTLQQQVTIKGEVSSPGIYALSRKDERISDLITRAGGLTDYAYPEGAVLIRKTEFTEKPTDNELNLDKLKLLKEKVLGDTAFLMNESKRQLFDRLEKLIIETENEEEEQESSFEDLSMVASDADSLLAVVKLNEEEPTVLDLNEILNNPGSKYDYIARQGDIITIPGKLETVRVSGEIISAVNLRYEKSFSFKDYINDAGGFTSNARKGRSYVQYPNGRRKQARRFLFFKFYPKVEPGSTIIVTRKPERDKLSIQGILAITSSLATITFLVDRISSN